jgi:hypothetical protein
MEKDTSDKRSDLTRYEFSLGRLLRSLLLAAAGTGALATIVEYGACL